MCSQLYGVSLDNGSGTVDLCSVVGIFLNLYWFALNNGNEDVVKYLGQFMLLALEIVNKLGFLVAGYCGGGAFEYGHWGGNFFNWLMGFSISFTYYFLDCFCILYRVTVGWVYLYFYGIGRVC